MYEPIYSPWGKVQNCEELCPGIYSVSTASHGGIMAVKDVATTVLSENAQKCGFWDGRFLCFEEDCDAPVAIRELLDKNLYDSLIFGICKNEDDDLNYKQKQIELFFSVHKDEKERAEYMKAAYSGLTAEKVINGVQVGYKAQDDGLLMWEGEYATRTSKTETVITETDDGHGNIVQTETTVTRTYLYITVSHKSADEMATSFGFNTDQKSQLAELLKPENRSMWSAVLYGIGDDDDAIVAVALSQVGNVGGDPYWSWYGFGSRVEWCACFVSWCANECGYIDEGIIPKYAGKTYLS